MTTQQQEAPQYELTLQDLQAYIAAHPEHSGHIIGICQSTCKCLGASALQWKYPGCWFEIPSPLNHYFCYHYETYPLEEEVSTILCEFDDMARTPWNDSARIDMEQLYQRAHDGEHPGLAQLFSSSSQAE